MNDQELQLVLRDLDDVLHYGADSDMVTSDGMRRIHEFLIALERRELIVVKAHNNAHQTH